MIYIEYILTNIAPYIMIFGLIIFVVMIYLPTVKLNFEKELFPLFEEQQCGALINMINHTWPFVRFTIYDDFIIIKTIKVYKIPIEKIYDVSNSNIMAKGLNKSSFAFSRDGIYINHCETNVPQNIAIWIRNVDPVITLLKSLMKKKYQELESHETTC